MRIVCPACEAEYDVPESIGGAGRKVRCARCQTVWVAHATMPAPSRPEPRPEPPPAQAAGASPAMRDVPEPAPLFADPPRGRSDWGRGGYGQPRDEAAAVESRGFRRLAPWIAAWVLSLVLLGAAGWAGYRWRDDVIRLWPASERLYAVLGPKGH